MFHVKPWDRTSSLGSMTPLIVYLMKTRSRRVKCGSLAWGLAIHINADRPILGLFAPFENTEMENDIKAFPKRPSPGASWSMLNNMDCMVHRRSDLQWRRKISKTIPRPPVSPLSYWHIFQSEPMINSVKKSLGSSTEGARKAGWLAGLGTSWEWGRNTYS